MLINQPENDNFFKVLMSAILLAFFVCFGCLLYRENEGLQTKVNNLEEELAKDRISGSAFEERHSKDSVRVNSMFKIMQKQQELLQEYEQRLFKANQSIKKLANENKKLNDLQGQTSSSKTDSQ